MPACTFPCNNKNKSFQHFFKNCRVEEICDIALSYFCSKASMGFWRIKHDRPIRIQYCSSSHHRWLMNSVALRIMTLSRQATAQHECIFAVAAVRRGARKEG